MFPQGFSARNVEPAGTGGGQLPISPAEGWPVIINSAEMVSVKDKPNDGMLVLNLMVIDGPAKGAEGPYRLNLFSSSEQASKIASQQLSALCWVTNKPDAQREEELFNIPFKAIVTAQTGEGKENYTQIKAVLDINGNKPGKAGSTAGSTPSATVQAPVAPPVQQAAPVFQQPVQTPTPEAQATPPWGIQQQAPVAAAPPWATKSV